MPQWFIIVAFGLFGLLFGSFANVVAWRVPQGESIVTPGSHCPTCDVPIAWYDNVPIVSFLVLRGRCRACGASISARYPLIEAASGALFALAAWRFDGAVQAAFAAALFWFLLVLSVIDVTHLRLPNVLVGSLAAVGVLGIVGSALTGERLTPLVGVSGRGWSAPVISALLGVLLAGGLSFAVSEIYARLRGKTGLGMGDVKLLATLGLFLGPYSLMALIFGSFIGTGYVLVAPRDPDEPLRSKRLPFGTFLAAAAVLSAVFGPAIWGWYAGLVGLA